MKKLALLLALVLVAAGCSVASSSVDSSAIGQSTSAAGDPVETGSPAEGDAGVSRDAGRQIEEPEGSFAGPIVESDTASSQAPRTQPFSEDLVDELPESAAAELADESAEDTQSDVAPASSCKVVVARQQLNIYTTVNELLSQPARYLERTDVACESVASDALTTSSQLMDLRDRELLARIEPGQQIRISELAPLSPRCGTLVANTDIISATSLAEIVVVPEEFFDAIERRCVELGDTSNIVAFSDLVGLGDLIFGRTVAEGELITLDMLIARPEPTPTPTPEPTPVPTGTDGAAGDGGLDNADNDPSATGTGGSGASGTESGGSGGAAGGSSGSSGGSGSAGSSGSSGSGAVGGGSGAVGGGVENDGDTGEPAAEEPTAVPIDPNAPEDGSAPPSLP